jgi:chromosome segregation ATPase
VIIKKYVGSGDYEREHHSSAFIIGVAIATVIILIVVIGVWLKYFHGAGKTEQATNAQQTSASSDTIAPAGEQILAKLQQEIITLSNENKKLKAEIAEIKSHRNKLESSVSRYSTQLKNAKEEKKDLLNEKANQNASVVELQKTLAGKQQELAATQSDLLKSREEARQCKNQYTEMYNKLQTVSQSEDDTLNRLLEQLKKTTKELNLAKEKNAQLEQKVKNLHAEIDQLKNPTTPSP